MAQRARISCINKTDRLNPHERIRRVGGFTDKQWSLTVDEAITLIDRKEWNFYTHEGGKVAEVIIASHNGHRYLKTEADGLQPDNLLALKECP